MKRLFFKTVLLPADHPERATPASKESHRLIAAAYRLAKEHVKDIVAPSRKGADRLFDWVEYLDEHARIIAVRVPDHSNAFTIFETLNDRGLRLAISDLLKNYLFHLSGKRIAEVQQRWISMTGALEAVSPEDVVVDFIRHLWSSKYNATREKELYAAIKEQVTARQAAIDFSNELEIGSRLYSAILNTDHELWSQYGPTARTHMATMNRLGMVQIRPLLLAVLQNFEPNEVRKSLRLMVTWGVRFLISGGLGGGTLEKHYCDRAVEIRGAKILKASQLRSAMAEVVPSDSQFLGAFAVATVSKSYLARYYLGVLENVARGSSSPELIPNPNEEIVNLEHVLPDNPGPEWGNLDEEVAKSFHKRIGNLALLQSRLNSNIGNRGFSAKRHHYLESEFELTREIAEAEDWGPEEINARQKRLAQLAVQAWSLKLS